MSNKCEKCLQEQRKKIDGITYNLSMILSKIEGLFQYAESIAKIIEMKLDTINDSKNHETLPF